MQYRLYPLLPVSYVSIITDHWSSQVICLIWASLSRFGAQITSALSECASSVHQVSDCVAKSSQTLLFLHTAGHNTVFRCGHLCHTCGTTTRKFTLPPTQVLLFFFFVFYYCFGLSCDAMCNMCRKSLSAVRPKTETTRCPYGRRKEKRGS